MGIQHMKIAKKKTDCDFKIRRVVHPTSGSARCYVICSKNNRHCDNCANKEVPSNDR